MFKLSNEAKVPLGSEPKGGAIYRDFSDRL